ncbi:MAG: TrbI/VirB10 family protein [Deltaproteobacteria bacterium]|nr:TrbI/VirB10 family protein [Deltaproteobacteria bacterium]
MILLGLLIIILCSVIYFHQPTEIPNTKETEHTLSADAGTNETEKREHFTAEKVRSISGFTPNKPQEDFFDSGNMGTGGTMEVLKNTGDSTSSESRQISVPPASVLEAHIDGKIVASTTPLPVVAFVDRDFENNGKLLVPTGAKLLGQTAGIQGKNRVLIRFDKIIIPGESGTYDLLAVAVDQDKSIGLPGEADEDNVYQMGTSFASTMVGLGMDSVMGENRSLFGELARQTMQNSKEGLSSAMGQNNYTGEQSYTVTLPTNMPIQILVTQGY